MGSMQSKLKSGLYLLDNGNTCCCKAGGQKTWTPPTTTAISEGATWFSIFLGACFTTTRPRSLFGLSLLSINMALGADGAGFAVDVRMRLSYSLFKTCPETPFIWSFMSIFPRPLFVLRYSLSHFAVNSTSLPFLGGLPNQFMFLIFGRKLCSCWLLGLGNFMPLFCLPNGIGN